MLVKPLAPETDLASDTDVSGASVVRLVNTDTTSKLVTVKDGSSVVASLTLTAGEVVHLQKSSAHTLSATDKVKAVKVAHAN